MADDLNAFLDGASPEEENAVAPEAAPAEAAAPEPEAPAAPEPDAEDEGEPEALDAAGIRKAMLAERAQRKDWKEKAIRAEEREAELRRRVEAFEKAQSQPQPQQYQQPQQEFVQRSPEEQRIFDEVNNRLNFSEMSARDKHGDEVVDAAVEEFKKAAAINPSLGVALQQQVHPYAWLIKQAEIFKAKREIGEDPNAYRSKLEAEIRAKVLAEQGEQPLTIPTRSPAAGLPPSLATARNAAPRGATPFNGPPALQDVFPS